MGPLVTVGLLTLVASGVIAVGAICLGWNLIVQFVLGGRDE